jgi:hypothetical protein
MTSTPAITTPRRLLRALEIWGWFQFRKVRETHTDHFSGDKSHVKKILMVH